MNNQLLEEINLEFAIIVSILFLVLGMKFYETFQERISFVLGQISYWVIVVLVVSLIFLI